MNLPIVKYGFQQVIKILKLNGNKFFWYLQYIFLSQPLVCFICIIYKHMLLINRQWLPLYVWLRFLAPANPRSRPNPFLGPMAYRSLNQLKKICLAFLVWLCVNWYYVCVCLLTGSYARKQLLLSAHLSHRNSVFRSSVSRVDQSKTVQARITKFSPSAARKTLVLGTVKFFHKFKGGHPEWKH